jgi:hypothetical protein
MDGKAHPVGSTPGVEFNDFHVDDGAAFHDQQPKLRPVGLGAQGCREKNKIRALFPLDSGWDGCLLSSPIIML